MNELRGSCARRSSAASSSRIRALWSGRRFWRPWVSTGGNFADGLPHSSRAVAIARERGLLSMLPLALWAQANALVGLGRFNLARSAAEEGIRLASDFGHRSGASWNLTVVALLDSLRGDESAARGHLDEAVQLAAIGGGTLILAHAEWVLGLLDLTLGRPDEATERLLPLTAVERPEFESTDRALVDPGPDRSGGTGRAARRDGGTARPLRELGAVFALRAAAVRAGALPGAGGGWGRARAIRGGAGARRVRLAISDGAHRAPLRRVAAARAPRREARPHLRRAADLFRQVGTTLRGRSAPSLSSAQPARTRGSGTPRRSTSSPLKSCRSPAWSPPA